MGHLGLESRIVIVSKVQDPTLLGSYILSKRAVSRVCKASRITTSCFTKTDYIQGIPNYVYLFDHEMITKKKVFKSEILVSTSVIK